MPFKAEWSTRLQGLWRGEPAQPALNLVPDARSLSIVGWMTSRRKEGTRCSYSTIVQNVTVQDATSHFPLHSNCSISKAEDHLHYHRIANCSGQSCLLRHLLPFSRHYLSIYNTLPGLQTLAEFILTDSWDGHSTFLRAPSLAHALTRLPLHSTLLWSISFYPQPWLNYKRNSTAGTTPAFPILNVLGFTCLSLQTISFYYSPLVRAQYRARNNGLENTNRLNDVLFAVHALLLSWITFSQYWARVWGFEKRRFKVEKVILGVVIGCFLGIEFAVVMVFMKGKNRGRDAGSWAWIDVVVLSTCADKDGNSADVISRYTDSALSNSS